MKKFTEHKLKFFCLQTCNYNSNGAFIASGSMVGTFQKHNQLTYGPDHQEEDVFHNNVCCNQANLCGLYYEVRPIVDSCSASVSFSTGNYITHFTCTLLHFTLYPVFKCFLLRLLISLYPEPLSYL